MHQHTTSPSTLEQPPQPVHGRLAVCAISGFLPCVGVLITVYGMEIQVEIRVVSEVQSVRVLVTNKDRRSSCTRS